MGGLEAKPARNYHPAYAAFIVPEQEISPGSLEAEARRCIYFIARLCASWKHSFFLCYLLKCTFCLHCSRGLKPERADGTQKGCLSASALCHENLYNALALCFINNCCNSLSLASFKTSWEWKKGKLLFNGVGFHRVGHTWSGVVSFPISLIIES